MMKRFFPLLFPLLIIAMPAQAAITIGALTQLCSYDAAGKETAPGAHASCQSYVAGIIDYHDLFKSVNQGGAKVDFCLPTALTYSDLQRIVLEYLQRNATHAESPAAPAVLLGLREEFPCSPGMVPISTVDPIMGEVSSDDVLNTPAQ